MATIYDRDLAEQNNREVKESRINFKREFFSNGSKLQVINNIKPLDYAMMEIERKQLKAEIEKLGKSISTSEEQRAINNKLFALVTLEEKMGIA